MIVVSHGGETIRLPDGSDYDAVVQSLLAKHGPWVSGTSSVNFVADAPAIDCAPFWQAVEHVARIQAARDAAATIKDPDGRTDQAPLRSTFSAPVIDAAGKARAEALNRAIGHDGDAAHKSGTQFFATGTALADSGVQAQRAAAQEHGDMEPARLEIARLVDRIVNEKRFSRTMTGGDIAKRLSMNGALRVDGYRLRPQAVQSLLARAACKETETGKDNGHASRAWSYVQGLRDRIALDPKSAQASKDKEKLLATMQHELSCYPDVEYMLRGREALGDIYAAPSPGYGIADAPEVAPSVLRALPDDARATVSYDPGSTAWEIRAYVHTPTPAELQVVGEPFRAYVVFRSRDNGTSGLRGGGGILVIRCLNATIYIVDAPATSRRHRARILVDLSSMVRQSTSAITKLVNAWGIAREDSIALPTVYDETTDSEVLVPLETAIPGFFRHMLTSRKGELVGVLPGRTEHHVASLASVYPDERRDPTAIVRADLANAYTRYIQGQPGPVRRDGEAAIGAWIARREPVAYAAS